MTDKEIIAIVEKATGEALNEGKLTALISSEMKAALEPLNKEMVAAGEDPDKNNKPKGVTFSQYLGDVVRMAKGQPLAHIKAEDMVRVQKAMYEGTDSVGGYLVPTEESRELLNLVNNWSVMRGLCREVPMRTNQITFPTLTGGLTAYWIPEATADKRTADPAAFAQSSGYKPASDLTLGNMGITAYVLAVVVMVSNQLLDDSDPSIDGVLKGLFAETLGKYFDIAVLRGAGTSTDPITGLAGKIATNIHAVGADFQFDDLVDLIFSVYENAPQASEVPLIGHPKAEKMLLKIKDDQGQYIYRGPTEAAKVPSVWGEPFYRNGNVSTTLGTGTATRIFAGDFRNAAFVGNRMGIVVKANPWANPGFSHNQTMFLAEMRVGFNVSDESRFAVLNGVPTL